MFFSRLYARVTFIYYICTKVQITRLIAKSTMQKQKNMKKVLRIFGQFVKSPYLCTRK